MLKKRKTIEKWLQKFSVENFLINHDLTINVEGNVSLSNHGLTSIPVQFNMVKGDFFCNSNRLKSLKGSPYIVEGNFYCHDNKLKNFKYAPHTIKKDLWSTDNKISSLEGGLNIIEGNFHCYNSLLKDLTHFPKNLKGLFFADYQKGKKINLFEHYQENGLLVLSASQINNVFLYHDLKNNIKNNSDDSKKGKI